MPVHDPTDLTGEEREIYERIMEQTEQHNRNNVTRTAAYLEVFRRTEELHWAFLAHMVSRNGGYSMTDLRGEPISRSMEGRWERERFFDFLERANWLIFGDAYPQLLLYEESKRTGRPLFHLLPHLNVSRFMGVIWERFWQTRDSKLLTLALINNEQNFIESRVVQNPEYQGVVQSFEFQAQTFLQLTHVVFPFLDDRVQPNAESDAQSDVQLAGVKVKSFQLLSERIDTGRHLYGILFGVPEVLAGVKRWAYQTPHTGSRADYWPHIYTTEQPDDLLYPSSRVYYPRVVGNVIRRGKSRLYSPRLQQVWEDVHHEPAGGEDWCVGEDCVEQLYGAKPRRRFNITDLEYDTLAFVEKLVAAETLWDRV